MGSGVSISLLPTHSGGDSLSFDAKKSILSSLKNETSSSVDEWLLSYVASTKNVSEVNIDEEMNSVFTYNITSLDDESILMDIINETKANDVKEYCLNAEMASLQTLSIFNSLCNSAAIPAALVSLNLSSNNLTDVQLMDANILQNNTIKFLSLASNSVQFATNITLNCTKNLLFLDLSYTEGLELTAGCFMFLNNLQKLILDGINLSSTYDVSNSLSHFVGLINLSELSLRENQINNFDELNGLLIFNHEHYKCLKKLCLAENPLPLSKYINSLGLLIDTLSFIDSQQVNVCSANNVPFRPLEQYRGNKICNTVNISEYQDSKGLDAMEAEYLSALKGERDNTVVS